MGSDARDQEVAPMSLEKTLHSGSSLTLNLPFEIKETIINSYIVWKRKDLK